MKFRSPLYIVSINIVRKEIIPYKYLFCFNKNDKCLLNLFPLVSLIPFNVTDKEIVTENRELIGFVIKVQLQLFKAKPNPNLLDNVN